MPSKVYEEKGIHVDEFHIGTAVLEGALLL